jgi:hypothetical protein
MNEVILTHNFFINGLWLTTAACTATELSTCMLGATLVGVSTIYRFLIILKNGSEASTITGLKFCPLGNIRYIMHEIVMPPNINAKSLRKSFLDTKPKYIKAPIKYTYQNKYGIIYLINNKINDKKYIGLTTNKKGFNGRYNASGVGVERVLNYLKHRENIGYPHNEHLLRSIEKYGKNNFEVIEEFDFANSKNELLEKERYWIKYYKSNDYNYGYNNTSGGEELTGSNQNFISKVKRRITKAIRINNALDYWFKDRLKWDNPYLYIWDYNDGLTQNEKKLLCHKLNGGKKNSAKFGKK